ncbi:MAG: hypothetical protein EB114_12390 [Betaproteobacteria bacterium]|nr:hypothetical protein [Betaproteobacteria bacterium]
MTENVFVTNNLDKDLYFEYNFVGYSFPVGKTVAIPKIAARHMLGYGDENKEKYLVQLGLIRLHSELEEVTEKFKRVVITEATSEQNRSLPSAVGVVPLRIEKSVGGKVNQRVA